MTTQTLTPVPAAASDDQTPTMFDASVVNTKDVDDAINLIAETVGDVDPTKPLVIAVTSADEYEAVGEVRVDADRRIKAVEKFFKPFKDTVNKLRAQLLDAERARTDRLQRVIVACDAGMLKFRQEQQAARDKAEREAREIAEREERDRIAREAQELQQAGDAEAAEELVAAPIVAAPAPVSPDIGHVPVVDGLGTQKRYTAEVQDLAKLLRWVAQDPKTRAHYIKVDQAALNRTAQAQHEAMAIPGVVCRSTEGFRAAPQRGRR